MTRREWAANTRFGQTVYGLCAGAAGERAPVLKRVERWVLGRLARGLRPVPGTRRKLLLVVAGCGRHVWPAVDGRDPEWVREWVERCERFADRVPTPDDLRVLDAPDAGGVIANAARAFPYAAAVPDPSGLWDRIVRMQVVGAVPVLLVNLYFPRESAAGCDLIREVLGDPFRPAAFDPAWRTDTAVSLARGMYDSRDFGALPILADALQDAGCEDADILAHCRGDGPHVRGCWVVDHVLGLG